MEEAKGETKSPNKWLSSMMTIEEGHMWISNSEMLINQLITTDYLRMI
jgi:hypothetical protein